MEHILEHVGLGVRARIKDLTQGDLEAFGAALVGEATDSASQRRGAYLRAALVAGWFVELVPALEAEQVIGQSPARVRLLGDWVDQIYGEVTNVPPG